MQQPQLETSTTTVATTPAAATTTYPDEMDSACSSPYVTAPSSPAHSPLSLSGYYYSAPTSPIHFILSTNSNTSQPDPSPLSTFEFDFSASLTTGDGTAASPGGGSTAMMSSADELFFNGQIRPMTLSTHLRRPETPEHESDDSYASRGRDVKPRVKSSIRSRRTRSLSPLRTASFDFQQHPESDEVIIVQNDDDKEISPETAPSGSCSGSGSGSRSSSVGRGSNRWVFLKELLYRSKSEGRNSSNGNKFWNGLSFSSPIKDKKVEKLKIPRSKVTRKGPGPGSGSGSGSGSGTGPNSRPANETGVMRKRRVPPPSAHELHYTANRAQAEEMRKKTFLPYRQGLLGCLGFSSKSYGAWNGFSRSLNPVSSR